MVYLPSFTMKINHPCRQIDRSSHGSCGKKASHSPSVFQHPEGGFIYGIFSEDIAVAGRDWESPWDGTRTLAV